VSERRRNVPESERERIREERRRLRAEYGPLFDQIVRILFRRDPMGISFETNTDEYEPEAGTILPRLPDCASVDDAQRVVREELVRWFGADGAMPDFGETAREVWEAWIGSDKHD
jgi:hypothetical protein